MDKKLRRQLSGMEGLGFDQPGGAAGARDTQQAQEGGKGPCEGEEERHRWGPGEAENAESRQ